MRTHKLGKAISAFLRQKERLFDDGSFKIYTLIIPFMAVTVLTIYTNLELSTRLFGVASPLEHQTDISNHSGVWLSIGTKKEQIVVRTTNGLTFSWSLSGPSQDQLRPLRDYLTLAARDVVEKSILKGQITKNDTIVALSVDQHLNFHHIRPVIYALAEAGFTKYGFETRILR